MCVIGLHENSWAPYTYTIGVTVPILCVRLLIYSYRLSANKLQVTT